MPSNSFVLPSDAPSIDGFAITPSDSVNFAQGAARRIFVGGSGVVTLVTPAGTVLPMTATAGTTLPIGAVRVNATGTTATLLVGLL